MTQADLAERSGVPLPTLKRFEQTAEISLTALLKLAWAMDALTEFSDLFPEVGPTRLDDIAPSPAPPRQRASKPRR